MAGIAGVVQSEMTRRCLDEDVWACGFFSQEVLPHLPCGAICLCERFWRLWLFFGSEGSVEFPVSVFYFVEAAIC